VENKALFSNHFHGVTIRFKIVILCILITLILGCSSSVNSVHDGLVGHVTFLASDELAGRSATSRGDTLAREYIAERFDEFGLKPGMGDSYFQGFIYPGDIFHHKPDFSGKSVYNVIGIIPGQDSNQSIVIGAHYDHVGYKLEPGVQDSICNGADDNASGIAVMLELARAYSVVKPLPCNLVFIGFTAEESGLLGAEHFVNYPPEAIGTIKAAINLDMVGRMKNDILYINHTNTASYWRDIIEATKDVNIQVIYDRLNGRNDAVPFVEQGIPAIWFFTGIHPDMHQVTDEVDEINFPGMEQIFRLVYGVINVVSRRADVI